MSLPKTVVFSVSCLLSKFVRSQLRPEAGFLHDAVWLYARAADKAIKDGKSPSDGKAIFSYINGTSYKSKQMFAQSFLFVFCLFHKHLFSSFCYLQAPSSESYAHRINKFLLPQ